MQQEIVASLEGARVLISNGVCELAEYDFDKNCWRAKQKRNWPLSKEQAREWVQGWNKVDGFRAFSLLIAPDVD